MAINCTVTGGGGIVKIGMGSSQVMLGSTALFYVDCSLLLFRLNTLWCI